MRLRSRIADEQVASLGGWLFADLFLLIMVIGLASFSIVGTRGGPKAITGQSKNVQSSSAQITGLVDAGDKEATAYFRWGTNSTLSSESKIANVSTSPYAAGVHGAPASTVIEGLKANTTYYFRLEAENELGKSAGEIRTFVTTDSGPCSSAPSFIKTPFEGTYTNSTARNRLQSDISTWARGQGFVDPKVAVAMVRGWTTDPSGSAGSSRAKQFFQQVMVRSDGVHFDDNTALEALQNQNLARGLFNVRLFFVEVAAKCK